MERDWSRSLEVTPIIYYYEDDITENNGAYKMNPIKSPRRPEALIQALLDGDIEIIAPIMPAHGRRKALGFAGPLEL